MQKLSPGMNIRIDEDFFKINQVQSVNVQETFSSVSAGNSLGKTEASDLQPNDSPTEKRVYQIVPGIKQDDIRIELYHPTATQALGTDNDPTGFITADESPFESPNEDYTLWVPPNEKVSIDAINQSSIVSITPVLRFAGFKYDVEELDQEPAKFKAVSFEAFGG